MQQEETGLGGPLAPFAAIHKNVPFEADATSERLGWMGLEAVHYRRLPPSELRLPVITHHRLYLFIRPPQELDLRYEGVKRQVPPPAGSIMLVPAGCSTLWRWSGSFDVLFVFLEP